MKRILLLLAAAVSLGLAGAYAEGLKVQIVPKTGDDLVFTFDQRPEVAFRNGHVTITVTGEDPIIFDFEEIDHIKTQRATSAVADVRPNEITVATYPENIVFGNVPENAVVEVYAVSGQRVLLEKAAGEFVLSRTRLSHGVYIVRINNMSFKVAL